MIVVLIGIQGSGKGELVAQLTSRLGYTAISPGALLRQEIATGSAIGKKLKGIIERGDMPYEEVNKLMIKAIKSTQGNIVIDAFPRNDLQADELDKICKVDKVIYLKLSQKIAIERLCNRLTCTSCQYITKKSAVNSLVCPKCNGKLAPRKDDQPAAIKRRIKHFKEETLPLVERYKKQKVLYTIDASKTTEEVYSEVLKVLL